MNNVEINKKYICEHIEQSQQVQFYNYFSNLQDQQHFQTWTLEKTIEIVNSFKSIHTIKVRPLQSDSNTPVQNTAIDEKIYTSLNLLEEIQEKKAIKLNHSNPKSDKKQQNWLNLANIPQFLHYNAQPIKFDNSLFQTFDNFIMKQPPSKDLANKTKTQNEILQQVVTVSKQAKLLKSHQQSKHQSRNPQLKQLDKQKGINSKNDKLFKQKINKSIKCNKVENEFNFTSVEIKNHQMVHRIFLPDYAMYNMQVKPANLVCKRTYDDFVCLKKTLKKLYPCVKIPYLQSGSWLSENDIDLINKNKNHLMLFMKGIIQHPLICKVDAVQRFLTIVEHKQIKKMFQELEKQGSPKYMHQISTQQGQLIIKLSSQQYELIRELPKWQNIFQEYFERYGDLLSNLSSHFQTIHQTYSQLQQLSIEMQSTLKHLTQHNTEIERQSDFQLFFIQQQTYYAKKQKQSEEQIIKLNQTLIPFLKYQKLNINQFKSEFESLQKLTDKYIKRLQNQPQSPSSLYQIHTLVSKNRFNEGIWEESENIQFFKLQLGYLHSTILAQTHIFSNRLINNLNQVWSKVDETNKQVPSGTSGRQRLSIKSWKF